MVSLIKVKAFTLIELLVVVAIIGILAAVGVVAYNGYTSAAKVRATEANLIMIKKYITLELNKCDLLGATTIMDGYLNCSDIDKGGVDKKAHDALNYAQNFKDKNPYHGTKAYGVGYGYRTDCTNIWRVGSTSIYGHNIKKTIKLYTCVKLNDPIIVTTITLY